MKHLDTIELPTGSADELKVALNRLAFDPKDVVLIVDRDGNLITKAILKEGTPGEFLNPKFRSITLVF